MVRALLEGIAQGKGQIGQSTSACYSAYPNPPKPLHLFITRLWIRDLPRVNEFRSIRGTTTPLRHFSAWVKLRRDGIISLLADARGFVNSAQKEL
jgi:hypothetical protein